MSTLHARSALMELLPRFRLCLGFRKEFEVHAAAGSTIVRLRGIAVYHRLGRRMQRRRPVEGRPIRKDGQATFVVSRQRTPKACRRQTHPKGRSGGFGRIPAMYAEGLEKAGRSERAVRQL